MSTTTTRRALIGGAGLTVAAAILPAAAAVSVPAGSPAFRAALDASAATASRFNALPADMEATDPAGHRLEMDRLAESTRAADQAVPTNWQEYTRLIDHMTDGGLSGIDDDNAALLLGHARRLSTMEGRA
jgi:uncharacterized protein (DUF885 family)